MSELRQQLLVLYLRNPGLDSSVVSWAYYDGTDTISPPPSSGDSDERPYSSVVDAMKDGWRVVQFPQLFPAYPGMEYITSYLRFEFILEKMIPVGA